MIGVIFEVFFDENACKQGHKQAYLDLASALKSEVEQQDGLLSIERFESLSQPGKLLSLSFWRDETALQAWRTHAGHKAAQQQGREQLFSQYRIRVGQIIRDYDKDRRKQAPCP